ncbi:hypothetical protein GCM10023194_40490 [Planotetraspora phitsanulokensis]|uniref:Uncharacterized protein n=1 Tax=Planotetraspora phitsanulokensis TaxID=575192 RepID=A0A8J3U917_9ACTN|nr:hypothetical protein Pph01_59660 [Planotetraspora phitsanulokensis]
MTVPGRTVKSSWSTAVLSPYRFVSWCASIISHPYVRTDQPSRPASPATLGPGPAGSVVPRSRDPRSEWYRGTIPRRFWQASDERPDKGGTLTLLLDGGEQGG